jgi:hypothetical protein
MDSVLRFGWESVGKGRHVRVIGWRWPDWVMGGVSRADGEMIDLSMAPAPGVAGSGRGRG